MAEIEKMVCTEASQMILEDEAYTVVSLCDRLSLAQDSRDYLSECCAPCPSYTTVPCSC